MFDFIKGLIGWKSHAAVFAAGAAIGIFAGWTAADWRCDASKLDAAKTVIEEQDKVIAFQGRQAEVTRAISEAAEARKEKVRVVTRTIVKEVPVYVTAKADASCPLTRGFVRVHDAAASGVDVSSIPLAAGQSNDDPVGIGPSAAIGTVAQNYGTCREIREQLISLQEWIETQRALQEMGRFK